MNLSGRVCHKMRCYVNSVTTENLQTGNLVDHEACTVTSGSSDRTKGKCCLHCRIGLDVQVARIGPNWGHIRQSYKHTHDGAVCFANGFCVKTVDGIEWMVWKPLVKVC